MSLQVPMSTEEARILRCWHVYLCLEVVGGQVLLTKRRHEALALTDEHAVEDENGEVRYDLPDEIDGKKVVGLGGDMVIEGDPEYYGEDDLSRLDAGAVDVARSWCASHDFDRADGFAGTWKKIETALNRASA